MTISNSKSPLLSTQNALSATLIIIFFFCLLLNNVESDSVSFNFLLLNNVESDSVSFNFTSFSPDVESINLRGDAASSGGALRLTKTDKLGKPIKRSVGLAGYTAPIQLYDKSRGKLADFITEFSFVVNPKGSLLHGHGFTFFLASLDFEFSGNTTGGFLGLFNPKTAFDPSKNKVVAIEFDSFGNEWDPKPIAVAPHIGIDVNSLKSLRSVEWPINQVPAGSVGKARISYSSKTAILSVSLVYSDFQPVSVSAVSLGIDFRAVLPEQVVIGFTASTGEEVETHDILTWSFTSQL